jgi:putative phage-type endonuclease
VIATGSTITPELHSAWLDERNTGIGASEAAAASGLDPYRSPLDLYLQKLGLKDRVRATIPMRVGNALEGLMAELYREETGREVESRQVFYRDHDRPHVFATVDGIAGGRVVEFKTTTSRNKDVGNEGDELPFGWLLQVQQQMHVTGCTQADIAVLVDGRDFKLFHQERNDTLLAGLLPTLDSFWGFVQERTPPPVHEDYPSDAELLAYLPFEGADAIRFGPDEQSIADADDEARLRIKDLQRVRDDCRSALMSSLGPFDSAWLPDGRLVRRELRKRKAYQVEESTFVQLTVKTVKQARYGGTP